MMFFEGDIGAPPTITVCSEEAAAILALPVSALAAQPIRPAATTLIPITFVKAFMGAILCFGAQAIPRSPGLRRRAAESFRVIENFSCRSLMGSDDSELSLEVLLARVARQDRAAYRRPAAPRLVQELVSTVKSCG